MSVEDEAGFVYSDCQEIAVAPNDERWDVFDGPGGRLVRTVDSAVLQYLEDNFDLPVQTVDGDAWVGSD